jgi:hypothetical protein
MFNVKHIATTSLLTAGLALGLAPAASATTAAPSAPTVQSLSGAAVSASHAAVTTVAAVPVRWKRECYVIHYRRHPITKCRMVWVHDWYGGRGNGGRNEGGRYGDNGNLSGGDQAGHDHGGRWGGGDAIART